MLQLCNNSAVLVRKSINNRETPAQQQTTTCTTSCTASSTTVSTASFYFIFQSVLLLCASSSFFFSISDHILLMDGMFPCNHTEVAVGNATIFILYSFFSLFLNGEELFLPIYSFCVCVNTFILNLKLIKYHISQPTILLSNLSGEGECQ